jgi:Sec-independent protein translocase protein TatA
MNILGIGVPELILIFVIAIVVAGPKRMIQWAFILGQYVGKLRAMWADVAKMIQAEVDAAGLDVKVPTDIPTRADVGRMIQQAAKPISDPLKKVGQEMDQELKRAQTDMSKSIKTPSVTDVLKSTPQPQPPSTPQPASTVGSNDLGTWGAAASTAKVSSNGAKPASPDLGTWGADSNVDTADRP